MKPKPIIETAAAEEQILGCLLLDPCLYSQCHGILAPEDFGEARCAAVYRAYQKCHAETQHPDIMAVFAALPASVAGIDMAWLANLELLVPSTTIFPGRLQQLLAGASARKARMAAQRLAAEAGAADSPEALATAIASASRGLADAAAGSGDGGMGSAADAATEAVAYIESLQGRTAHGTATGITELDHVLGPLMPGEMVVVAARPGVGKSALALYIAAKNAVANRRVAFFSLEMPRYQVAHRGACLIGGLDSARLYRGQAAPDEMQQYRLSAKGFGDLPILIDDDTKATAHQVRARCLRTARRGPIGLVIVDYLTLLRPSGQRQDRRLQVGEDCKVLLELARDLGCPVLVLSQLNRGTDEHEKPTMSMLRESGDVEQDATKILLLSEDRNASAEHHAAEVNAGRRCHSIVLHCDIAKSRHGPKGQLGLVFDKRCGRFDGMR